MSEDHQYPPFEDLEYAAAFAYLRESRAFAHLVPPRKTLHVDWFLMQAIGKEVMRRRAPGTILPMLVGSVVREFVPDTNPKTRELGKAYRNAIMKMLSRRSHFRRSNRRYAAKQTERPVDATGQRRLI